MEEETLPIVGYCDYNITTSGQVTLGDRPITPRSRGCMRHAVEITDDTGCRRAVSIPRLVAITFLPRNKNTFVGFKDGNQDNYHVSNLEWTTRKKACKKMIAYKTSRNIQELNTKLSNIDAEVE